jgi:hypothetical protein
MLLEFNPTRPRATKRPDPEPSRVLSPEQLQKFEWLVLTYPDMMQTFEDIINDLQARHAAFHG